MIANAEGRALGRSFSSTATLLGAGLLILLGTVLQLGVLGYDHVRAANLWPFSVIVESAWNVLAMHANGPALDAVLRFWPLVLVSAGLAILMLRSERS